MLYISYTIRGDAKLMSRLNNVSNAFSSPEPFKRMGKQYLKWIASNFKDEGRTFGKPWLPLSAVTLKIKRRLYEKHKAIAIKKPLVRTGALKKSFDFTIKGRRILIIYSSKDYAELHQTGGKIRYRNKFRTVPRRILLALDEKHEKKIEKIYSVWLNELLKKQGFYTTDESESTGGWVSL